MVRVREGRIAFRGYGTWYRAVGEHEQDKTPVLAVHGGPGLPHESLAPLEAFADKGRRVVFYDQLGCGNSDRPEDLSSLDVRTFVEELAAVRRALGLDRVHLLGHSWGGALAMEYAATEPAGIVGLVLVGTPSSREAVWARREEVYEELPPEVTRCIRRHEAREEFDAPRTGRPYNTSTRATCAARRPGPIG